MHVGVLLVDQSALAADAAAVADHAFDEIAVQLAGLGAHQGGAAFGYNVSQNKQSITLNEKNLEDEVVITNDVISGSKKEKQLTNPSSGFAGDSATAAAAATAAADPAAMAGSEESERAANASANAKTGDETPIALYIGLLAAALAIIIAVILILKRRKRG